MKTSWMERLIRYLMVAGGSALLALAPANSGHGVAVNFSRRLTIAVGRFRYFGAAARSYSTLSRQDFAPARQ